MKTIKYICLFVQRRPLRLVIIRKMSYLYKKNVKYDKNRELLHLLLLKTLVEDKKKIPKSLKTLDFVHFDLALTQTMSHKTCSQED